MTGFDDRHDRRDLLRVGHERDRHAIESHIGAALRDLDRNLRLHIVEAADVADRQVLRLDAVGEQQIELLDRGVFRHRILRGAACRYRRCA
jgi:hypothetical protein